MANTQKDNRSGDSRSGQDKNRGSQSSGQSSSKNNPSGESRGQNPGALHNKGNAGSTGKSDKDRGGSRM